MIKIIIKFVRGMTLPVFLGLNPVVWSQKANTTSSPVDSRQILEEGVQAYFQGSYSKSLYFLIEVLKDTALEQEYQIIRWEYSAISAAMLGRDSVSAVYFLNILNLNPNWTLASNQKHPSVVSNFNKARYQLDSQRLKSQLGVIAPPLPQPFNFKRLMPLGIPQFDDRKPLPGRIHLLTQVLGSAIAIYSSYQITRILNGQDEITMSTSRRIKNYQNIGLIGISLSITSYGISIWQRNTK